MLTPRRFVQILNAFSLRLPAPGASSETSQARQLRDMTSASSARAPDALPSARAASPSTGTAEKVPTIKVDGEFVTPLGKRRLQVVRFIGGGKRAKVYHALEPGSGKTYALKIVHERTPASLRSMALEAAKADALAAHRLPHARILELSATYALKEWIDGIGGDQWLREWMQRGSDPTDPSFLALVDFFRGAAAREVHITDLKPPNMILRNRTEWVPVDPGLVIAPVSPAVAMKYYRERFARRWLRASRSPVWAPVYWFWCRTKRAHSLAAGEAVCMQHEDASRRVLEPFAAQRGPSGLCFWGTGLVLPERMQSMLVALDQHGGPDVEILKRSTRRSVFRVRNVAPEFPSIIVKGFPLVKIESRVKYRKYGLAEFSHYQQAARRGIPMPACYGYFEVRTLGLVKANGVLIEDLAGWRSLADLARANPARRPEILASAIPLLSQLYETGVNHIDSSPQNILRSPDGTLLRLIDWQYCSFVKPRLTAQLLMQAAHFLTYANVPVGSTEADEWLTGLAEACHCQMPGGDFRTVVSAVHARGRMSAKERLALSIDAGSSEPQPSLTSSSASSGE